MSESTPAVQQRASRFAKLMRELIAASRNLSDHTREGSASAAAGISDAGERIELAAAGVGSSSVRVETDRIRTVFARVDFLFEIIEDRHGNRATVLTSQLPVGSWHDHLGDPTIADAICDRLLHRCHVLNISGRSYRLLELDRAATASRGPG